MWQPVVVLRMVYARSNTQISPERIRIGWVPAAPSNPPIV